MKRKIIRIFVFIMLVIAMGSFSTTKEEFYKEQDGVHITYTRQQQTTDDGHVMEYLILKIANKNAYAVKCNWKLDLWYNDQCRTCQQTAPTGYEFELELQAGQTVKGNVKSEDLMLKIYSKSIKPATDVSLTKFDFTKLAVQRN